MIRNNRGFTLIEIMIVLVIIALMAGAVSLAIGGNKEKKQLEVESRRLLALLQLTSEEAVLTNLEIAMRIDDNGYEFKGLDEENLTWLDMEQSYLKARVLPKWIKMELEQDNKVIKLKDRSGEDEEGEGKRFEPQIVFLSSGESTAFDIKLKLETDEDTFFTIKTDGLNGIEFLEAEDER